MNRNLSNLLPYPFERLSQLLAGVTPNPKKKPIRWSIGEPAHKTPQFVKDALAANLDTLSTYPMTKGTDDLREAIADWVSVRFSLPRSAVSADSNVIPVSGTREALFSFAQCVIDSGTTGSVPAAYGDVGSLIGASSQTAKEGDSAKPLVVMPNPFYQIYEGATLLAGAQPYFINLNEENGFIPDFESVPADVWERCQLLYVCSPGNPTGACLSSEDWRVALRLADKYDFVVAADECYSELYFDENEPPVGLLDAAYRAGRTNFERCAVFHSLSKRSNLPGLRSGFVAGDPDILKQFLRYRTYHGCTIAPPAQVASAVAWRDEKHVIENRELYRQKFDSVISIVGKTLRLERPVASFYLWPELPCDDTAFTKGLYEQQNLLILPGSYLSRDAHGTNPGRNRARIALVAPLDECVEGAERLREFLEKNYGKELEKMREAAH